MGIDAEMLVKVRGEVTPEQLNRWSWNLTQAIGAKHFMISRDAGKGAIILSPDYEAEYSDPPTRPEQPGKFWSQDGETLVAEPGETFLKVRLATRYYGPGYERGDILTICAVAEWCEANIPDCAVWYGGDSSGVVAEPFGAAAREAMRQHLYSPKGRAYFRHENPYMPPEKNVPDLSSCKLCVPDRAPNQYGFGGNYAAWYCSGCGFYFIYRDGVWTSSNKAEH